MAAYLSMRIIDGALDYLAVTSKFSQFKEDIDRILVAEGKENLIIE